MLKQLFTSVLVKVVNIYLHFGVSLLIKMAVIFTLMFSPRKIQHFVFFFQHLSLQSLLINKFMYLCILLTKDFHHRSLNRNCLFIYSSDFKNFSDVLIFENKK